MSPGVTCGDRSGFLFAHACDRTAIGQCVRCGKPICVEHTRMTEAGPTCIACLRDDTSDRDHGDSSSDDRSSGSSGSGRASTSEPGVTPAGGAFGGAGAAWAQGAAPAEARADDPYFYGGPAAYYDADDARAFDTATADAEESGDAADLESDTGAS